MKLPAEGATIKGEGKGPAGRVKAVIEVDDAIGIKEKIDYSRLRAGIHKRCC